MKDQYDDIINLPHPVSRHHQQMSMMARAAQFAPFAALSGHDEAIHEMEKMHEEFVNRIADEGYEQYIRQIHAEADYESEQNYQYIENKEN